jgi:peptidoglycan/LPS O-acetylase OafA/YrhL
MTQRTCNLDALRHLLAAAVIVSHAWPLAYGPGTLEPLESLTGISLGGWAVGAFFFISGLLIASSAERKPAKQFWTARARRIVPGLGVALVVTLGLAMACGSTADPKEATTWYLRALTLISIEHRLPDAFVTNPYPEVVNGPLWSLSHEVIAYGVCASFVWAGCFRKPMGVMILLVAAASLALAHDFLPGRFATFAPLFFAFALGMAAHWWKPRALPFLVAALAIAPFLTVLPLSLAPGFAGFCLVALALCLPAFPLKTDASYGLYIYGWPIAQTIVFAFPGVPPLHLATLSVLATYPVALASWHYVERSCLKPRLSAA